jgi:heat shock protein HslJ
MGRLFLCSLLAWALCGGFATAQDQGVVVLGGSLNLPKGTLVGDGAIVTIEAYDRTGAAVGEATFRPRTETGPLPFGFGVPAEIGVTIRAALVRDGRTILFSGDITVTPGAAEDLEITLTPYGPIGPAGAFRCGQTRLGLTATEDGAFLAIEADRLLLEFVASGEGRRYESRTDPGTWVETRGNAALVAVDGEQLPLCVAVPPPMSDVWDAGGNEPGWRIDTAEGRVSLVWNYGEQSAEAEMPSARLDDGALIYDLPDKDLTIHVRPEICYDDATGMPHPDTVLLTVGDRTFPGCGGDPRDTLSGRVWQVTGMFGKGMADDPPATLVFDKSGTLGGSTGCNVYRTEFTIGGENISAGPLAATKRLCDEVLNQREAEFFIALRAADRFEFDDSGALVLIDDETAAPVIRATPVP